MSRRSANSISRRQLTRRAAFTLLELLLALALTTLIAALIHQGLQVTQRAAQTGVAEQRQRELTNALQRRLRTQLARCGEQSGEVLPLASLASAHVGQQPIATQVPTAQTGLWGSEHVLVLLVWNTSNTPAPGKLATARELVACWSTTAQPLTLTLPEGVREFDPPSIPAGLELRSIPFEQFANASPLSGLLTTSRPLAPEIRDLRFRYYDGRAWHTRWDSTMQRSFPESVEVQFRLVDQTTLTSFHINLPALHRTLERD